jgi:hypothetical protein
LVEVRRVSLQPRGTLIPNATQTALFCPECRKPMEKFEEEAAL